MTDKAANLPRGCTAPSYIGNRTQTRLWRRKVSSLREDWSTGITSQYLDDGNCEKDTSCVMARVKINKKTGLQGDGVLLHQGLLWAPDLPLSLLGDHSSSEEPARARHQGQGLQHLWGC
ncbi:hypothetical protein E2I00_014932 [Balaenoptera physalus]|uniref:Uncharacterized protein n=1 Tax=Balaenoptera physalus TaxID=9770 RepID=A0A643C2K7_BALPH|nr:hypothetical protein E2I00_014932 [Balaenoptera physalus]